VSAPPPATVPGPTVRLRPVRPTDYAGIFAWYNDPDIVAPYDRFSVDSYEEFVRAVELAPDDPTSLAPRSVVERLEDGRVLGVVGHYRAHPVLAITDIWYVLGERSERGKGYGSGAVGLLVDRLSAAEVVERIGATCDVDNAPSYRLLEKVGFRREGTLRSVLFHHQAWHDVHVYGITRADRRGETRRA
jgi:RimJ/RimL family protein N-acetyltransferase